MPRGTGQLQRLAREISADERSLRRAVEIGAVQAHRPTPRRLEINDEERSYLRDHWRVLAEIRAALRTEPNVRTAVLFGSLARGTEHETSDIDLLVELKRDTLDDLVDLEIRLMERLGREVQLTRLSEALTKPEFLWIILQEGRTLVDRQGTWQEIRSRSEQIKHRAKEASQQSSRAAHRALRSMGAAS